MGAYLSKPNTEKNTADGGNQKLSYGLAAMQGWRVSMEVKMELSYLLLAFFFKEKVADGWITLSRRY